MFGFDFHIVIWPDDFYRNPGPKHTSLADEEVVYMTTILRELRRETMNCKAFVEEQVASIRESVGSGTQDKS